MVMEEIEGALTMTDQTDGAVGTITKDLHARKWLSLPEPGYAGRFQPDTELEARAKKPKPQFDTYEDWLLYMTTQEVETEINVQLGTFTLKKQAMQVLPSQISRMPDFEHVFGKSGAFAIQSAAVRKTENRTWLRLVGRRHDVHWWEPWCPVKTAKGEAQGKPESDCTRKYPGGLRATENWVQKLLDPWVEKYQYSLRLRIQTEDCSEANVARLAGYFLLDKDPNEGHPINQDEPLHELVLIRDPAAVHVYNIVEYGRRWQRELVFSSSVACLHNMKPEGYAQGDHVGYKMGSIDEYLLGEDGVPPRDNPALHWAREHTLVITRNVSADFGVQTLVPDRFLRGIVPDSLLADYEFWQDETDDMIGYPLPHMRKDPQNTTVITVELLKEGDADESGFCNSHASGKISRVAVSLDDSYDFKIDTSIPTLTLLNLMTCSPQSALVTSELRRLLLRMEDFSNILVWTKAQVETSARLSADVIELPRLKLSFSVKEQGGELRLFSDDHDGMFVSNTRSTQLSRLLDGLPTCLLLENKANDFSILVPAGTRPTRFEGAVLTDRSNAGWLDNLGDVRHYMYPIHLSGTFLTASTLASSLYMMVWRLFTGAYGTAFKLADSCLSDTKLSPEEAQIWQQIGEVENDVHPDACACRLKMSLVTMGCEDAMPCKWNVQLECQMYGALRHHVCATCRLTHAEELDLINLYGATTQTLVNRKAYLDAFAKLAAEGGSAVAEIKYPALPKGFGNSALHYERLVDNSCVDRSAASALNKAAFQAAKTKVVAYRRPLNRATSKEPEEVAIGGPAADRLHGWIDGGLSLTDTLGFLFFYELFTGTLKCQLSADEPPGRIASALLRLLPSGDTQPGTIMSILRVLDCNPHLAASAPPFEEESAGFSLRGALDMGKNSKARLKFLDTVMQWVQAHAGEISMPDAYVCPESHWKLEADDENHPAYRLSPPICALSPPNELKTKDRTAVCPRVPDFARIHHYLHNFRCTSRAGSAAGLTQKEVEVHAADVLAPIGLPEYCVELTQADRGLKPIDGKLPFSVVEHPSAKSHVAKQMNDRLTNDKQYFATVENDSRVPKLKHMLDADIKRIVDEPGAHVDRAVTSLQKLEQALDELQRHDREYISATLDHCVALANSSLDLRKSHSVLSLAWHPDVAPRAFLPAPLSGLNQPVCSLQRALCDLH